jgi:membrane-associated phospholipid phosphatase
MQLGNLVVGTGVGLAIALVRRDWRLAVAVLLAMVLKLVIERVLRHQMAGYLRPSTPGHGRPGAILRGADVPASGPSFPSGHVILVAAVATVLANHIPLSWCGCRICWWWWSWWVGSMWKHNPLDVTAGLGAGLLAGGLVDLFLP